VFISSNDMDGKTAVVTGTGRCAINNAPVVAPLGASPGIERAQRAAAIGVSDVTGANLGFLPKSDSADCCGLIRRR
jgi:hypothetical protein